MRKEILNSILEAGIKAPSADNMQPWRFVCRSEWQIEVRIDERRTHDFATQGLSLLYLSVGAVIENMRVAANQFGFSVRVQYIPDVKDRLLAAVVDFKEGDAGVSHYGPALQNRLTNRKFYSSKLIPDKTIRSWMKIAAEESFQLIWIPKDDARYQRLSVIMGEADKLRFEVERLHREFFKTLKLGENAKSTQEGLTVPLLDAGFGAGTVFSLIRSWSALKALNRFGLSKFLGNYTTRQMRRSSGAAILIAPKAMALDFVRGGEIMERVWNEASLQDIAMQPMEGLPVFMIQSERLQDFSADQKASVLKWKSEFETMFDLKPGYGLMMLWRAGFGTRPSIRSPRRNVESFFTESSKVLK